jgi:GntR family transcriptional regulator, transcriptional repressor for pyruvate dehydrogenase complex
MTPTTPSPRPDRDDGRTAPRRMELIPSTMAARPASSVPQPTMGLLGILRSDEPEGATLADQVASRLESAIAMGILAEGTRLPPEPKLAAVLGSSPMTLRSALASLRSRRLIATSRGRGGGSVVRRYPGPSASDITNRLLATGTEDLRDCGDLYTAVASTAAELAADRADDGEVARLEEIIAALSTARSDTEFWRMLAQLVVAIGVASQSSKLTSALLQIQAELAALRPTEPDLLGDTRAVAARLQRLVSAIRSRDGSTAAAEARLHCRSDITALIDYRLRLLIEIGASDNETQQK